MVRPGSPDPHGLAAEQSFADAAPGYKGHRTMKRDVYGSGHKTALDIAAARHEEVLAEKPPSGEIPHSDRHRVNTALDNFHMGGVTVKETRATFEPAQRLAERIGTEMQNEVNRGSNVRTKAPMGLATDKTDYLTTSQMGPGSWHETASSGVADRRERKAHLRQNM
jgi:hypothetical protein